MRMRTIQQLRFIFISFFGAVIIVHPSEALSPTSNLHELDSYKQLSQLSDDDYKRRIIEKKDQIVSSLRDLGQNPIAGRNRLRELLPLFFQLGLPEALEGRSYTVGQYDYRFALRDIATEIASSLDTEILTYFLSALAQQPYSGLLNSTRITIMQEAGTEVLRSANEQAIATFSEIFIRISEQLDILHPVYLSIIKIEPERAHLLLLGLIARSIVKDRELDFPEDYYFYLDLLETIHRSIPQDYPWIRMLMMRVLSTMSGEVQTNPDGEFRTRTRYHARGYIEENDSPRTNEGILERLHHTLHNEMSPERLYEVMRLLLYWKTKNPEALRSTDPSLIGSDIPPRRGIIYPDWVIEHLRQGLDPKMSPGRVEQLHGLLLKVFEKLSRIPRLAYIDDMQKLLQASVQELEAVYEEVTQASGEDIRTTNAIQNHLLNDYIFAYRYLAIRYNVASPLYLIGKLETQKSRNPNDPLFVEIEPSKWRRYLDESEQGRSETLVLMLEEIIEIRNRIKRELLRGQIEFNRDNEWDATVGSQILDPVGNAHIYPLMQHDYFRLFQMDFFLQRIEELGLRYLANTDISRPTPNNYSKVFELLNVLGRDLYTKGLLSMGILEETAKLQRKDLTDKQRYSILDLIREERHGFETLWQEEFKAPIEWMVGAESGPFLERLRFSDDESLRWFDQLLQSISIGLLQSIDNGSSAVEPYL